MADARKGRGGREPKEVPPEQVEREGGGEELPEEPADRPGGIYGILPKVAEELGNIGKTGRAPDAMGGYPYRKVDDIVNGLAPLLTKHGVTIVPRVREWRREHYANDDGKFMAMTLVCIAYRFYASDGSYLEAVVLGEAADRGDKATPKALTAAFKAALLQTLTIPTGDEDTEAAGKEVHRGDRAPESRSSSRPATSSGEPRKMKSGAPWPSWWKVGEPVVDPDTGEVIFGTATDEKGNPVEVEGKLHTAPDEALLSGGKAKSWPTLEGSPWVPKGSTTPPPSAYEMMQMAIRARLAGEATPEKDPILWVLSASGKGAYKGEGRWPGETAVALDFYAEAWLRKNKPDRARGGDPGGAPDGQPPVDSSAPSQGGTGGGKPAAAAPAPKTPDPDGLDLDDIPF